MTVSTSCWGSLLKVECNNNHDYTEVKTVVKNWVFFNFPFKFLFSFNSDNYHSLATLIRDSIHV